MMTDRTPYESCADCGAPLDEFHVDSIEDIWKAGQCPNCGSWDTTREMTRRADVCYTCGHSWDYTNGAVLKQGSRSKEVNNKNDDKTAIPSYSTEHLPEGTWSTYQKKVPTRAMRIHGPFIVETSEGPLRCKDGYLAMDARGYPYPIATDEFALIYEEVSDGR